VILNPNLIDAFFDFGALGSAGRRFAIFVSGPNGTSRNLFALPAGAPPGCVLGNEQGLQVTFTCNVASPLADSDMDGIPDSVEPTVGTNPSVKDNDVFNNNLLFVMQQYRDFLGREGDAAGIAFWVGQLNANALTRPQVIEAFFFSTEFQAYAPAIIRLYFATFLRIPDYAGLAFWVNSYRGGTSLAAIAEQFTLSQEFQNTYGSLNNTDFVTLLYNNVLGRAPDPGGLAFWVGQLNANALTRGDVLLAFSESTEFRSLIANEVFVTQMYVGMLRRMPEQAGFDFWVALLDNGASRLSIIASFFVTVEYHNRFLPPI
jgi:hypothetical protein